MQPPSCIGSLQVVLDNQKMVWASRDNYKMMIVVILEAWVGKIEQKYVFPNEKTLNFDKLTVISLTASQQPLFAVPEHMTHPVQ